ncbi:Site-specific recombinase XerD [Cnuella takakiae]|uniref:Site-specific recombinase XerD n=1 Tax=Cnuella takakiae TaxID=1302690 RepID=A0A1M5CFE3_9BACT|nr:site-specific integrase [Cnuella takakiae]OLY91800.1 hypothetical protein BUE76_07725 [Cnuella takakiae]SHF53419.1 Site-specific recombinase XerD [Cnuella takakiae]
MAKDKTTIRFWLRTDKPNQDGTCPVHLIYQVKGERKYYGVPGVKLLPLNWDANKQLAVYLDKKASKKAAPDVAAELILMAGEVEELNSKLEEAKRKVADVEARFRLDKATFTAKMVVDTLKATERPLAAKEQPKTYVVDFIRQFAKDVTTTHKEGTIKVYTGLAAHLAFFERNTRQRVTFEGLDVPTLRSFHAFLVSERIDEKGAAVDPMNNTTSAKQMSTLKTLLNYARTIYKIPVRQDYRDYKVSRKDSDYEVIALTESEFLCLWELDLSENKRLEQVRDVFCFSCTTGLRYSDLADLKRAHIRKDGSIKKTAVKTGQKLDIPLNQYSAAVLDKYKERLKPLPIISGQKTNLYLKELCQLAGIDTPIERVREYGVKKVSEVLKKHDLVTIHSGRRTFATLSLEKGMASQEVMAITGHTTYKSFKRYVDVAGERKKAVMAKAWGAAPAAPLEAV